jgi:hypothetical protein
MVLTGIKPNYSEENLSQCYFVHTDLARTDLESNRGLRGERPKRNLIYLKTQFVSRSNTLHLGYKNQSVNVVQGKSRCLF